MVYFNPFEKTEKELIAEAWNRRDAEERIPVLRLELDYELATLYDALQAGDRVQVALSKVKLQLLRREMLMLEM